MRSSVAFAVLLSALCALALAMIVKSPPLLLIALSAAVFGFIALFTSEDREEASRIVSRRVESLIGFEHIGFGEALLVIVHSRSADGGDHTYEVQLPDVTIKPSVNPRVEVTERETVHRSVNSLGWTMRYSVEPSTKLNIWVARPRE